MAIFHDISEFLSNAAGVLRYKGTKFMLDYLTGSGVRLPQINPDGSFSDSGLLLTQLALVANYGSVAYVTSGGNDTTALVGRLDRPYATPQAAINNLPTGGTLWMFPGTYTGDLSFTLERIVNIFMMKGAIISGNLTLTSGGGGTTLSIFGYGQISGNITGISNGNKVYLRDIVSVGNITSNSTNGTFVTLDNITTVGNISGFGSLIARNVQTIGALNLQFVRLYSVGKVNGLVNLDNVSLADIYAKGTTFYNTAQNFYWTNRNITSRKIILEECSLYSLNDHNISCADMYDLTLSLSNVNLRSATGFNAINTTSTLARFYNGYYRDILRNGGIVNGGSSVVNNPVNINNTTVLQADLDAMIVLT